MIHSRDLSSFLLFYSSPCFVLHFFLAIHQLSSLSGLHGSPIFPRPSYFGISQNSYNFVLLLFNSGGPYECRLVLNALPTALHPKACSSRSLLVRVPPPTRPVWLPACRIQVSPDGLDWGLAPVGHPPTACHEPLRHRRIRCRSCRGGCCSLMPSKWVRAHSTSPKEDAS